MQTLSLFTSCLYVQWLCRRTISLLHVCYNKIYCRTWYCSGASDKYPQSPPANVYIYIKWVFCWCLFLFFVFQHCFILTISSHWFVAALSMVICDTNLFCKAHSFSLSCTMSLYLFLSNCSSI